MIISVLPSACASLSASLRQTPTPLHSPTPLASPTPTMTPTVTPMPTSTPTPTPTPLPTPMALVASVNAYNPINLYEEPDARSRVVGALAPGTLVPILEISESGMWLKVGLDVVGWVAGTQVSLSGTFYAHAGTSPTRRGLIQSDTAVNVRNGPGTSSRVLGQIKAGQVVDVDGWSDDGKWAQIPYNGVEGWVALSTVILTGGEPTATPAVTEEVTREP